MHQRVVTAQYIQKDTEAELYRNVLYTRYSTKPSISRDYMFQIFLKVGVLND